MHARASICLSAAVFLCAAGANAACPQGQTKGCATVNLSAVPEITDQIVSREAATQKKAGAPRETTKEPYTGPTVGVSDRARRAPMVGYRWAID